ncbi:hypothetical protein Asal01_01083 [Fodinibius salicampi]
MLDAVFGKPRSNAATPHSIHRWKLLYRNLMHYSDSRSVQTHFTYDKQYCVYQSSQSRLENL